MIAELIGRSHYFDQSHAVIRDIVTPKISVYFENHYLCCFFRTRFGVQNAKAGEKRVSTVLKPHQHDRSGFKPVVSLQNTAALKVVGVVVKA